MIRRVVSLMLAAVVMGALAASSLLPRPRQDAVTPPRASPAAEAHSDPAPPADVPQGTPSGGVAQPGSPPIPPAGEARTDPAPPAAAPPPRPGTGGLGPATSFVAVVRGRQRLPLDARQNADALAAVGRLLDSIGTLTPEPGGVRLLTELRLNEYLLDVTVWSPQTLDVGGTRLIDVSGIVIPFTGAWRNRILIVRGGTIAASPPLLDSSDLAALERLVEASGRRP